MSKNFYNFSIAQIWKIQGEKKQKLYNYSIFSSPADSGEEGRQEFCNFHLISSTTSLKNKCTTLALLRVSQIRKKKRKAKIYNFCIALNPACLKNLRELKEHKFTIFGYIGFRRIGKNPSWRKVGGSKNCTLSACGYWKEGTFCNFWIISCLEKISKNFYNYSVTSGPENLRGKKGVKIMQFLHYFRSHRPKKSEREEEKKILQFCYSTQKISPKFYIRCGSRGPKRGE